MKICTLLLAQELNEPPCGKGRGMKVDIALECVVATQHLFDTHNQVQMLGMDDM